MSTAYKANVPIVAIDGDLPSQTSITNGKALISNGSTASWQPVTAMIGTNPGQVTPTALTTAILPSQTGNSGKVLQTDGTTASWVAGPVGYTGSQGITGYTGSTGATGFTGSHGVSGYTGSTGATGFTGSQGVSGYTGSRGAVDVGNGVGSYLMIHGTYTNTGGGGSMVITPFDGRMQTWDPPNPGGTWHFRGGVNGVANGPTTVLSYANGFPDPVTVGITALVQRVS